MLAKKERRREQKRKAAIKYYYKHLEKVKAYKKTKAAAKKEADFKKRDPKTYESLPGEIWSAIPGHENYAASSLGRIKSLNNNLILKTDKKIKDRRINVCLGAKFTSSVHRLVAITFLGKPKSGLEVNHIDGNPLNNKLDNLEWVTSRENKLHAFRIGLHVPYNRNGERNPTAKIFKDDCNLIRAWHSAGFSIHSISRNFKISRPCIGHHLRGECKHD